jgi:alkanesulfonate monooxygenase SsuD/methylene tetrahydromethanopterin reductase-like flavin-dependent oxidoreductase (luciferase family)
MQIAKKINSTQQNRPIIAINGSRDAARQKAKRFCLTFFHVVQGVPQVEVLLRRRRRRAARRRRTRAVRLCSHLHRRPEKAAVSTCNTKQLRPIVNHAAINSQKLNKAIKSLAGCGIGPRKSRRRRPWASPAHEIQSAVILLKNSLRL